MTQTYTFTVVVQDSGDEFSQEFNPADEEAVIAFEESMAELLRNEPPYWETEWKLTKVTTEL